MKRAVVPVLALLAILQLGAASWFQLEALLAIGQVDEATVSQHHIQLWEPLNSDNYATYEKIALIANVFVAIAGLIYALMLVGQVKNAPQGTPRMQEIAQAIREGANAYLYRQFSVVGVLIIIITGVLYWAAEISRCAEGDFDWTGGIISGRLDLLGHGGLRGHAAGHDWQSARGRRRSTQFWPGTAARLSHRHDHRHAHRWLGSAWRIDHLLDLR